MDKLKTYVKCTGISPLLIKGDALAIFQSKDASVVVTIVIKENAEKFDKFKIGHEYELMLTE